jgi:hypothetical protein
MLLVRQRGASNRYLWCFVADYMLSPWSPFVMGLYCIAAHPNKAALVLYHFFSILACHSGSSLYFLSFAFSCCVLTPITHTKTLLWPLPQEYSHIQDINHLEDWPHFADKSTVTIMRITYSR